MSRATGGNPGGGAPGEDFFALNLAALRLRHPAVDEASLRGGPAELEILPTPAGAPTGRLGAVYLHSRYDPVREAQRLVREGMPPAVSLGLFYGFGLGYLVESFVQAHPHTPVAVVEPEPGLFGRALAARDLRALLARPEIHWLLGGRPEQALLELEKLPLGAVQVVRLRPVYDRHAAFYEALDGLLQNAIARREVNTNTLRRFGRLWVRNLLANLDPLLACPGVAALEGRLAGLPAVVLAAGPSLESILPLLPRLRERLVLIAVDTSLRPCLNAGVEPDFLLVIDPQYWNSRHLDRARPRRTVLVSETSTWPGVFRRLRLPTFLASSLFPLGEYLESVTRAKGRLGAGGSVATSAWDFARLAGARPILMAGLDLGFPGRRTHARGTFFEELRPVAADRLSPAEEQAFRYLIEAGPSPCPSNDGGTVLSDRRMAVYRGWFETQMRLHPHAVTRSLSREGARIAGMPFQDSRELLELPPVRREIDRRLEEIRALAAGGKSPSGRRRLRQALARLLEEQRGLEELAVQGLEACRLLEESLGAAPAGAGGPAREEPREDAQRPDRERTARLLERLDLIDSGILARSSRQVTGFLLHSLIQEITQRAPGGGAAGALESSRRLYRELRESARYHCRLLERRLASLAIRRPRPG